MHRNLHDLFPCPREWEDEESKSVQTVVRQWAEREIISRRLDYLHDYDRLFTEKRRMLQTEIGLQRLTVPEECGGFGWNRRKRAPAVLAVLNEIARADAATAVICALAFTVLSPLVTEPFEGEAVGPPVISLFSGDELRTASVVLPGPGTLGSESVLFLGRSIPARIHRNGKGYRLTSPPVRAFPSGPGADVFCTACADEEGGISLVYVPVTEKGIIPGPSVRTTGLNACGAGDVAFDNVAISPEWMVNGEKALRTLYTWLNLCLGGVSNGAALNFFEILSDWAESRTIKGGIPMKENPLCASVLAEAAEEIFLARRLLSDLAGMMARDEEWEASGGTRLFTFAQIIGGRVQESALKAVHRGMELMGSAGYAREWHAEKHWRDIKTIQSCLCGVGAGVPAKMDTARYYFDCREV